MYPLEDKLMWSYSNRLKCVMVCVNDNSKWNIITHIKSTLVRVNMHILVNWWVNNYFQFVIGIVVMTTKNDKLSSIRAVLYREWFKGTFDFNFTF